MDAFSIAISIGLQYGVPLEAFVSKYINMRFEPAGMTDDADVRIAQSVMDYIFRRLALDYLPSRPAPSSASSPPRSVRRRWQPPTARLCRRGATSTSRGCPGRAGRGCLRGLRPPVVGSSTELLEAQQGTAADAPLCYDLRDQDAAGGLLLRVRGLRQPRRLRLLANDARMSISDLEVPSLLSDPGMYNWVMDTEVRLRSGLLLLDQHVLVATEGCLEERHSEDLLPGDWVGLPYGTGFPQGDHAVPLRLGNEPPHYGNQRTVTLPTELTEELALLLGIYASEGHTTRSHWSIIVTNADEGVPEDDGGFVGGMLRPQGPDHTTGQTAVLASW